MYYINIYDSVAFVNINCQYLHKYHKFRKISFNLEAVFNSVLGWTSLRNLPLKMKNRTNVSFICNVFLFG